MLSIFATRLLNRLLPHHCPICDCEVADYGLCPSCWVDLCFITEPLCDKCGRPLMPASLALRCGACLAKPPLWRQQRAVLRYDEASKRLILPFKHARRLELTPLLADLLLPSFHELVSDDHLIIPVPLHLSRRLYRTYNQSAELCRRLCQISKRQAQFRQDICLRRKATTPLGRHNAKKRHEIVKGAFMVPKRVHQTIKGRPLLVIDDVHTTGATLHEIAKTLTKAGAGPIDSLTIARIL